MADQTIREMEETLALRATDRWYVTLGATTKLKFGSEQKVLKTGAMKWVSSDGKIHDSGKGIAEQLRLQRTATFLNLRKQKPCAIKVKADGGKLPN